MKFGKLSTSGLEQIEKLEQLRILENGYNIKVVETKLDSIGVDCEADLDHASVGALGLVVPRPMALDDQIVEQEERPTLLSQTSKKLSLQELIRLTNALNVYSYIDI